MANTFQKMLAELSLDDLQALQTKTQAEIHKKRNAAAAEELAKKQAETEKLIQSSTVKNTIDNLKETWGTIKKLTAKCTAVEIPLSLVLDFNPSIDINLIDALHSDVFDDWEYGVTTKATIKNAKNLNPKQIQLLKNQVQLLVEDACEEILNFMPQYDEIVKAMNRFEELRKNLVGIDHERIVQLLKVKK